MWITCWSLRKTRNLTSFGNVSTIKKVKGCAQLNREDGSDANLNQTSSSHLLVNQDQRLFLALDDGSSKYSKLGGSCAIGNKYQLVVADEDDQDYALPLDNEAGFKLTTGDPETDYFGSGLTLDFKNASLALRDDSGILDGAVTLNKDAALPQNDAQRRDDMTKLGGKIC